MRFRKSQVRTLPKALKGRGMETSILTKACYTAAYYHGLKQQIRKYSKLPYIVHPAEVVSILESYRLNDYEVLCAAWMHDILEDCGDIYTKEMMTNDFGYEITRLVLQVTDISKPEDGNRAKRKEIDRFHLSLACYDAQNIKLADLISNTRDIAKHDKDFAKVYLNEKKELLKVLNNCSPRLKKFATDTLLIAQTEVYGNAP